MRVDNVIADLIDGLVGTRAPTDLRFFTSKPAFWKMLAPYKDRIIVEFGCGRGDTIAELKSKGFRASGCDLHAEPKQIALGIHALNAIRFPLVSGMVVVACRPDHSGWVGMALERAQQMGCVVIYISKPSNYDRDIGGDLGKPTKIIKNVGVEGESAWMFVP